MIKRLISKKAGLSYLQILILVIATFAFSYIIYDSTNEKQVAQVQAESSKESMINWIFKIVTKPVFQVVSAATPTLTTSCCEKTNNNEYCADILDNADCTPGKIISPSKCDSTSFCKKGCCVDEEHGTYDKNIPQELCSESLKWYDDKNCNIPGAKFGCCFISDKTYYTTQQSCEYRTSIEGNGLGVNWKSGLNEAQCVASAQLQTMGACVLPSSSGKNCKFTTKSECISLTGFSKNFFENILCTSKILNTGCIKTQKTMCVSGLDEVYFADSCGNRANIYDASQYKNNSYWESVIYHAQSCNPSSGNANSKDCGNCNRFLGGSCSSVQNSSVNPSYGDYYCKDTSCTYKGKTYKNGESWCVYEGKIGNGDDVVGSRHWKYVCSQGEVQIEPCADFRNEICVQSDTTTDNGNFTNAACRINGWQKCIDANANKGTGCSEPDCELTNVNVDSGFAFDVCTPKYPEGFFSESDAASQICGIASMKCTVIYQKTMAGSWKCIQNCNCEKEAFSQQMNEVCRKLGDCGGETNIVGKFSRSYSVSGAPDDVNVEGLTALYKPIEGQKAKPGTIAQLTGSFDGPAEIGESVAGSSGEASLMTSVMGGLGLAGLGYAMGAPIPGLTTKGAGLFSASSGAQLSGESAGALGAAGDVGAVGATGVTGATGSAGQTITFLGKDSIGGLMGSVGGSTSGTIVGAGPQTGTYILQADNGYYLMKSVEPGITLEPGQMAAVTRTNIVEGVTTGTLPSGSVVSGAVGAGTSGVTGASNSVGGVGTILNVNEFANSAGSFGAGGNVAGIPAGLGEGTIIDTPGGYSLSLAKGESITLPESSLHGVPSGFTASYNDGYVTLTSVNDGGVASIGEIGGSDIPVAIGSDYSVLIDFPVGSLDSSIPVVDFGDPELLYGPFDPVTIIDTPGVGIDSASGLEGVRGVSGIEGTTPSTTADAGLGITPGAAFSAFANLAMVTGIIMTIAPLIAQMLGIKTSQTGVMAGTAAGTATAIAIASYTGAGWAGAAGSAASGAVGVGTVGGNFIAGFNAVILNPMTIVIAIVVAVIVMSLFKIIGVGKTKKVEVIFTCKPWQAPVGGEDCSKCNNDPLKPCSDYRCRSLGAACKEINVGTEQEMCAQENVNDVTPPSVNTNNNVLINNTKYININEKAVKITNLEGGCVDAYTNFNFGLTTSEPSYCKYDLEARDFAEMRFDLGSSSYVINHTAMLILPDPSHGQSQGIDWNGSLTLYAKCQDTHGNEAPGFYTFDMCVNQAEDITPTLINYISPENNGLVAYNKTSQNMFLYTKEPSDCKWDLGDVDYNLMENQMTCNNDFQADLTALGYLCNATLPISSSENKFYVRCKDQPWLEETNSSDRNANTESFIYTLKKPSSPLSIKSVSPSNEVRIITDSTTFKLRAETGGGAENPRCSYSFAGYTQMIPFYTTYSNVHEQEFNLATGRYVIYVECEDITGDKARARDYFEIIKDTNPPIISRVFFQSSTLKVITAKSSECKYSSDNELRCDFSFSNSSSMGSGVTHSISAAKGKLYFIKCKDELGISPDGCSVVVSPR